MFACLRPLTREVAIAYFAWALRDLQKKDPHHPDLPEIVNRLRDLRAERAASTSVLRKVWQWL